MDADNNLHSDTTINNIPVFGYVDNVAYAESYEYDAIAECSYIVAGEIICILLLCIQ